MIVHVHSVSEFDKYALHVPKACYALAEKFSPGPLTFVLPKRSIIPPHVSGGGESVALRVPNHPLAITLLQTIDFPLAAPSANPSGYISPVTAKHVYDQLKGKIPYILDGGTCDVGLESTVVSFANNDIHVLRLGGIPLDELRETGFRVKIKTNLIEKPDSPGQMSSHYAPRVPMLLGDINQLFDEFSGKLQHIGVLDFGNKTKSKIKKNTLYYNLSPDENLTEAARNVFYQLRLLDEANVDLIIACKVPDTGLGMAINDRLIRAAFRG